MLAFLDRLPRCQPARPLPSIDELRAQRWHPADCVAVRGRLSLRVLDECPSLVKQEGGSELRGCVQGWVLSEPSRPLPQRRDAVNEQQGISLFSGNQRCDDDDARRAGVPESARLPVLLRPGNGEVASARDLPQPIVALVGAIPGRRFKSGESVERSDPVDLTYLEVTHLCIVE